MYSYEWDAETGGYKLNNTPLIFSKEPRPVYYEELDILGFDQYWKYDKNDMFPYMWAESNNYYYRGRLVAKTKGGSLCQKPEVILVEQPEPEGDYLRFVDIPAMVEKNREIMESLTQETIKKIYNYYMEYRNKIDVFYVAFSGGKDSVVTLDLVARALPHNDFKVLFGDTGMEFPDTYDVVDKIEEWCLGENIVFLRSKSEFNPEYTWSQFGPPATVVRWCCSVHKTSPQILRLRDYIEKNNFTGMAFVGVRGSESLSRSEYDYVSLGEKHKGQWSCNPILEWNSAELYLYIFSESLILNSAYKKGNRRAGCLVCPGASERNEYMARECYQEEFDALVKKIKEHYNQNFQSEERLQEFIENGGWKARKNGRDLHFLPKYSDRIEKGQIIIQIREPNTDWKIWMKTVGVLEQDNGSYSVMHRGNNYSFDVLESGDDIKIVISNEIAKQNPLFIKLFKNVFRKAAQCIGCHECEADCHNGCLSMQNGEISISDDCKHCSECHKALKGCLVYNSIEIPKGDNQNMKEKSLNCYSHFAPKMEWFEQYIKYENEFDENHTLGSQMYSFFKRFLRDSEMLVDNKFSSTAQLVKKLGLNDIASWGIMFTNAVYSPQLRWFVTNIDFECEYSKDYTISLLEEAGAKTTWAKDIWSCFNRFASLPFGDIGFGNGKKEKDKLMSIYRTSWSNPDSRVILYALYKFAEKCGGYYSFTLNRLLDHDIDSDGISPTQIFGLDRDIMIRVLNGLASNYPEFISVSFTIDLDNIYLKNEKTSSNVLELF
ncbi:MAG: phosphoadenosine phosphosulfate reductase family protein [Tyzzerella sp.]|nr:phosphoadenosine phosphosulfate reductase family protein [Tyzzerella sp.]